MDCQIIVNHGARAICAITRANGRYSAKILDGGYPCPITLFGLNKDKPLTHENIEKWLKRRVIPPDREDIAELLEIAGLSRYDYFELLKLNKGRSTDDPFELEIIE
jgi:hypothetical protein